MFCPGTQPHVTDRPGFKLTTLGSSVRLANHPATAPHLFTFYPFWPPCCIWLQLVRQYHTERCTALDITVFAIARLHVYNAYRLLPLHTSYPEPYNVHGSVHTYVRQTMPMFNEIEWDIVTRRDIVRINFFLFLKVHIVLQSAIA